MNRRGLIRIMFAVWVIGMIWSAWSLFGMAPTGDGLVRGINRIFGFMIGQAGAGLGAVMALILGWKMTEPADKWLARGPALLSLVIALSIAGLIAWQRQQRAEDIRNAPPPKPVTAPADTSG